MGGEQAATVLATITKDQRAREGKEVKIHVNHPVDASLERLKLAFEDLLPKNINIYEDTFLAVMV